MSRTYGSYMIQPTKDQIRHWLWEARRDLKAEKAERRLIEGQLNIAKRKLGALVLEGKIAIPVERLGELALELAVNEQWSRATEDA